MLFKSEPLFLLAPCAHNNNEAELVSFFENTGAVEVKVIEKH